MSSLRIARFLTAFGGSDWDCLLVREQSGVGAPLCRAHSKTPLFSGGCPLGGIVLIVLEASARNAYSDCTL
jgi:hypothetical protein